MHVLISPSCIESNEDTRLCANDKDTYAQYGLARVMTKHILIISVHLLLPVLSLPLQQLGLLDHANGL